jgi:hypothetical protein
MQNEFDANPNAVELEPWLIVLGDGALASLAMWRLALNQELSVALFASRDTAQAYCDSCCEGPAKILQVDRTRFLGLMVDCFRQGIRYATLNPGDSTAQRLFVLREPR